VEARPGRPPIDPKILVALWLYATLDGVGSARRLERLCTDHNAYRWICGGVGVNYHTLSDFRVDPLGFLDDLFTRSVAALLVRGALTLNRVAQDGVRVRARAGTSSFRRRKRLKQFLHEAGQQVQRLREELEADPGACERRQRAASAEWVNAQARTRGLRQFLVRGMAKAKAVVLWYALAHNLMRMARLNAQPQPA
jgi:transposase